VLVEYHWSEKIERIIPVSAPVCKIILDIANVRSISFFSSEKNGFLKN